MIDLNLTPTQLPRFRSAVEEIVVAMKEIKNQQEYIKDIAAFWKEEAGMQPKTTKAVAKLVYEQSLEEERSEKEAIFNLTELLQNQ